MRAVIRAEGSLSAAEGIAQARGGHPGGFAGCNSIRQSAALPAYDQLRMIAQASTRADTRDQSSKESSAPAAVAGRCRSGLPALKRRYRTPRGVSAGAAREASGLAPSAGSQRIYGRGRVDGAGPA